MIPRSSRRALTAAALLFAAPAGAGVHETLRILPPPSAEVGQFGRGLAADGPFAIARGLSPSAPGFVFHLDTGAQALELQPADPAPSFFALSAATDGRVIVLGGAIDETPDWRGLAVVFDAATGRELRRLTHPDASPVFARNPQSIAIAGSRVLIADPGYITKNRPGRVHVFNLHTGDLERTLTLPGLRARDEFGFAVVARHHTALVTARLANAPEHDSGAAYLFNLTDGSLIAQLQREPLPPAPPGAREPSYANSNIGYTAALDDGLAILGSAAGDRVWAFDAATGEPLYEIDDPSGNSSTLFGVSVALSDGLLAVGSVDPTGPTAVYVFDAETGARRARLEPSDPAVASQGFGLDVELEGSRAIVGALFAETRGAVYLFDVPFSPADLNGDGCVGPADLAALVAAWGTTRVDLDGDGSAGPSDVAALIAAWTGC